MPKLRLRSLLPWLLVFHPRGPFRSWGPWIGVALFVAILPFALNPNARERALDTLFPDRGTQTATTPTNTPPQGGVAPSFDPLRLTGAWALRDGDLDRAQWSWERAKRQAADIWEAQMPTQNTYQSYYCGCTITRTGPSSGTVDTASCGYADQGNPTRAKRLEWEHIMPAATFGGNSACWTTGLPACRAADGTMEAGRSCCERADPIYQMMSNDPVNLTPAIGEVNGRRSNLPFGILPAGEGRGFGAQCGMRIDTGRGIAHPPAHRRGDIARITAYMSRAYGIALPKKQADMYTQWMAEDPVSTEEIAINRAIQAAGQRPNPLVLTQP